MRRFQCANTTRMSMVVLVLLVLTGALGFAAGQSEQGSATDGDVTEVNIWVHNHPPLVSWLEQKAAEFNEQNADVNVVLRAYPSDEMRRQVMVAYGAGDSPEIFDLFAADFANVVSRDMTSSLDVDALGLDSQEEWTEEWFGPALETAMVDGEVRAVPYLGNPFSLFINKEHFEEAGLDPVEDAPETWEELIEVADQLTIRDDDGEIERQGFALPYNQGPHWWGLIWVPILRQYGGSVLNEDGTEVAFNDEAGVQALQLFHDMVHEHRITSPGVSVADSVNVNQDFIEELTSMWISGTWAIGTFEGHDIMDKYAVVPLPQVDPDDPHSMLGGWWWYVADQADPEVQAAAWRFLDFYTQDPGGQLENTGLVMPKKSLLDSQAWEEFPYHEAFAEDLAAGGWPYMSLASAQIEDALDTAIDRVLIEGADPKEALDSAAERANEALADLE